MNTQTQTNSNVNGKMIINGQLINLFALNETPKHLEISNLARGLCGIIRFNGYAENYSVAMHSLILSRIVPNVANALLSNPQFKNAFGDLSYVFGKHIYTESNQSPLNKYKAHTQCQFALDMLAYDALIHDFSESLTGDVIRPFKMLLPELQHIEERVDLQIRRHYLAYPKMPYLVNLLDKQLAVVEAHYLTRNYDVTLIDIFNPEQVKMFNDVFFYVGCEPLRELFGIKEKHRTEPLTEVIIDKFLRFGLSEGLATLSDEIDCDDNDDVNNAIYRRHPLSLNSIKALNRTELLGEINDRFLKLRKRLEHNAMALFNEKFSAVRKKDFIEHQL